MEDVDDGIAVVGIGCNFPGGEGLDHFWKVLLEGKICAVDIPGERFDTAFWFDPDESQPGKTQTTKASLVDVFNEFDHKFFGITEMEADFMDPQQKLLLQCTYRALEDGGIAMDSVSGSRTGVYIGLMNRDYETLRNNNPPTITHYNGTGTAMSMAANRISFTFNFTGPSLAIDSACSSSLVALHLACQAIKQGDCEMALCGGVNSIIEPRLFVALSKAKMISPDGISKPFAKSANGYGRGEGCGVVLLKPLKNAIRDCNKIWGVISKTAVNQDGHSVTPITRPSIVQQEELLRRIYSKQDIASVQYIEAHGTGTPVGDLTEAESLSNVVAKAKPSGSEALWIGSVKGNIGHTESAAGVAGLIKVLLMMKHETLVPSVFFSQDSSSVDLKTLRLAIPTRAAKWRTNGSLNRIAGINNFGFGGTNAHAIVREYRPTAFPTRTPKGFPNFFVISAASEKSLVLSIRDTQQRLCRDETVDLHSLSYTSACGRSHNRHRYRKAVLTSSISDLQHRLASVLKTRPEATKPNTRVIFVFSGNGVSYRGMCKKLFREVPIFRDKVREIENAFQNHKSTSICKWLADDLDSDELNRPDVVQPLLFAIQTGLATLLRHWGVRPEAVLGHSLGEVAAAHCSGLLSLEDAVKVVYLRSSLHSKVTVGKMLVVGGVTVEKILAVVQNFSGKVCVAAFNSPLSCTLSGDADAIDAVRETLKMMFTDKNVFLHILDVPAAYHSHLMDPIIDEIDRCIGCLAVHDLKCDLYSTVTGGRHLTGDFTTGRYWSMNVRKPVLFEKTLRAVAEDNRAKRSLVFVEIGPRRSLRRNILETLGNGVIALSSVLPEEEHKTILSAVANLFELGIDVLWHHIYEGFKTRPTAFPVYHFDNTKKPLFCENLRNGDQTLFFPRLSTSKIEQSIKDYTCHISLESVPYLWKHKINGVPVVPGAFYVELAYASVTAHLKSRKAAPSPQLSVTFQSLLTLNSNSHRLTLTLENAENGGAFRIYSSVATHASGTYRCIEGPVLFEEPTIHLHSVYQRCKLVMSPNKIYSILSQAGFEYEEIYRHLDDVYFGDELREAVSSIHLPAEIIKTSHDYFIHPVILDYFLQMTAVVGFGHLSVKQGLPSAVGSVTISGPLQEEMVMYLRATQETLDFLDVCGCFCTAEGKVLVEMKGVRIKFLDSSSNVPCSTFFHNERIPITAMERSHGKLKALVFADEIGIAESLGPYLHPASTTMPHKRNWKSDELQDAVRKSLHTNLSDVIYLWGVEDLSHLSSERVLDCLVSHCELLRQVVLALKDRKIPCTVHVITYKSTGTTVDYISPGFVLSGMTRACAAEIVELSFQLIDVESMSSQDIETTVRVINDCKRHEVTVSDGQASTTRIAQTPRTVTVSLKADVHSIQTGFVLQTADAYRFASLSAAPSDKRETIVPENSVEVRLTNVCVHSSDYFPVTLAHLKSGRALYWNEHASQKHQVLALDFSGMVTAVGKGVKNLKAGDHVASCYPVAATAKVIIPDAVCYNTGRLPFLEENPCVSYFLLAWVILQRMLSVEKQMKKLTIIASDPASVLINVLALTANKSGWNVSCLPHLREPLNGCPSHALVFLPPFDHAWQKIHDNPGRDVHVIFLYSSHMAASIPANIFAVESEHVHIHKLDVASVLQRANLKARSRNVFDWLTSLSFDKESLPLKKNTFQISAETQSGQLVKSYFSSMAVEQVVLQHRESSCPVSDVPLRTTQRQLFRKHCVYIVTGGLSGLGLETVKFIGHNGGGYVVTLSRRALTNKTRCEMEVLQKTYGITIMHIKCDVSVSKEVVRAIAKTEQTFVSCPIKGVFHSAAVLHDAMVETLDESLFRKVLQPKVGGALNLHYATVNKTLDFFVCYSSISSFIGNASQCNYAAANSFLDAFCHYRRHLGLAGQSINWGPLNLGLLLNKIHFQKFLETKGMMIMDVCEFHEALMSCLLVNRPQQAVCKFNFRNLNFHVLSQNAALRERLSNLVETKLKDHTSMDPQDRHLEPAGDRVRKIVSEVSNVSVDELEDDFSLSGLGIDSMLAMTLQNRIFQETGVNVPLVRILDPSSTLCTLAAFGRNNE